jgi:folylpolyglutamate synthase/dihydropteroate synthase
LLGSTREEIAKDKAGIIKAGRPVVIGPYADLSPIIEEAKLKNSPLFKVDKTEGNDF